MFKQKTLSSLLASGLMSLGTLVNYANASPIPSSEYLSKPFIADFDKVQEKINELRVDTREGTLLTYEEWKAWEQAPKHPRNNEELKIFIRADLDRQYKVLQIITDPEKAFSYLTKDEKILYKYEFRLFDPVLDTMLFNQKYNLNLSFGEFQRSPGAKLLWFLDRRHSYRYSDEKAKKK